MPTPRRTARLLVALLPLAAAPAGAELSTTAVWTHAGSGRHGAAVTTAGDFNCDGSSDLAVGTPDTVVGLPDDGKVEIWYGAAYGLAPQPNGPPNFTFYGDANARRQFGASLAAGDVDGDLCDDIIVGSPAATASVTDSADVRVYFGNYGPPSLFYWMASGFSNPVDHRGHFGASVASADVNGDELADVIVGEPRAMVGGQLSDVQEGAVLVWLGSATIREDGDGNASSAVWTAQGNQNGAHLGASVAGAGDVDRDGDDDILAGAPDFDDPLTADEGRAALWYGSPTLGSSPDGTFANAVWRLELLQAGAHLGASVAGAGDVDRDGYADFLVGEPDYDNTGISGPGEGRVLVVRGGASGPPANAYSWSHAGTTSFGRLGAAVATAADVNGDGVADWLAGEPGTASVHLQLGTPGPTPLPFPSLSYSELFASFGASVGAVADFTDDGFADVVVGAPDALGGGRVFVYRGGGETLAAAPVFALRKGQAGAGVGFGLGSAGDINHDGFSDFVTGAPGYESAPAEDGEGRVYVAYGGSCGPACAPVTDAGVREGGQFGAQLGWSASGAGDVNNDGYTDVIAGAPTNDRLTLCGFFLCTLIDAGQARLYMGSASGLSASPAAVLEGPETGAQLGFSVASAGDVNSDGHGDVIVGAPYFGADEGRAYLYLGSPQGLIPSPARTLSVGVANSRFGIAVASAGDVNGDGFSDVVVGADGHNSVGAAFLFLGEASPYGVADTPARTWTGGGYQSSFGLSVASAGDVNGDGRSDVIVGAPTSPWVGGSHRGEVAIFHGGSPLPSATANATLVGDVPVSASTRFGSGVAAAGDVNGDGFGDVIVGDQWFSGPAGFAQGKAYVFHGGGGGVSTTAARTFMDCENLHCDFGRDVAGNLDVNGDGFSDVLIGAFKDSDGALDEGAAFVHLGNDGRGTPRQLLQFGTSVPVSLRGLTDRMRATLSSHSAAGRAKVRVEWQDSLLGSFFNTAMNQTVLLDNAFTPSPLIGQPALYDAIYISRYRIRTASPLFGRARWISPTGNAPLEADVRTMPEPGFAAGLGGGVLLVVALGRRRALRAGSARR